MSEKIKKGKKAAEGKTKILYKVVGDDRFRIVASKDDITKNDNKDETRIMSNKAAMSTATTCAVFQFLKDAGIPVAFERQLSPTEFLAPAVKMIPLEVVWRRYAVGSFLKRHPELERPGKLPHRFHQSVFEFFLKTTNGIIRNKHGDICGHMPEDPRTGHVIDDPLIKDPYDTVWSLLHPKEPAWSTKSRIDQAVFANNILLDHIVVKDIEILQRRICLILEAAWAQLGCRFIDIKLEYGVLPQVGKLLVADVIDADSWRLRDASWQELSKQLFRDNADMEQISDAYALIARLVQQFRIPKQAVVIWRGSKDDPSLEIPAVAGVTKVDIVLSGHKSPQRCLRKLEEVLTDYPDGGVILADVGMSNGLGPVLAARTSWPVIGVPLTIDQFHEDVWSSLRMPSQVPMGTVLSPKNAALMALNILGQKNPAAYAERQLAIEELDE